MKHDESELLELAISAFSDIEFVIPSALPSPERADIKGRIANACKDYAEHMTRWRPISERPEIGQMIIIDRSRDKEGRGVGFCRWMDVDNNHVESHNVDHWTWKPLDLPENES